MVGEGDFAGLRFRAATHQRRAGGRVMGLAEGPLRPVAQGHATGDGLNGGDFQRFMFGQGWKQSRQTTRQKGFPGARWSAEQQVVVRYTPSEN